MRSKRQKHVIIAASRNMKKRKQALYDLMAHLAHTHTHKQRWANQVSNKSRLILGATLLYTGLKQLVRKFHWLSYKLCSKIQITLSNLHDHNRIKLFMLITPSTSRRVAVTTLSVASQLSASLFLSVCVWPLPELLSECAWPLRVFLHHQPWRDSENI